MATAAERQLYPFSSNDGQVIPLDIIRPLALSVHPVAAAGAILVLPSAVSICAVFSTVDMVLDFTGAAANSATTEYTSALFVPAGTLITAIFPDVDTLTAVPMSGEDGLLSIQQIQKWAGIGTDRQLKRN